MAKQVRYEEAMRQLKDIVARMESDELDVDSLTEQLKTAKKLIKTCKDRLIKTDEEIRRILDDDK